MDSRRIEISSPDINEAEALANVAEAIRTRRLAQGVQVELGEKALASVLGTGHAALLNNGTSSLRAALVAAVASKQDIAISRVDRYMSDTEVIIPAFSFNATINTVLQSGATAHVVDINDTDFTIDESAVERAINPRTSAIMPVDLYGLPSMVSPSNIAFDKVAIVRDAAQAHGALISGKPLTHHADAVSLSFYPTKNLSAPEGGAVLTENQNIDATVRIYRNQGMARRYEYEMIGDNLRMSDIHAGILRANIARLAFNTLQRQENAASLTDALKDIPGVTTPSYSGNRTSVWHQYTIKVEDEFGLSRDELSARLDERGIGSGVYYPRLMTDHEVFKDHPRVIAEPSPKAQSVAAKVLSLPVHPGVGQNDINRIAETIEDIRTRRGR